MVLIAILALFGLRGFFRGLFREVFSLAGLIAGFMLAVAYDQRIATYIDGYWKLPPLVLKGSAFVAIFFLVYFVCNLVGWLLHRWASLLFLQTLNRSGGIAIGVGKGAALTALALFLLSSTALLPPSARAEFAASYLSAPLTQLAESLVRIGKETIFSDHDPQRLSSADSRLQ